MLGAYGGREFETPNLDAFARRALRFEKHYTGSLPCIPARHDILCGALDFLWKPWGSIEIWEHSLIAHLRRGGRDDACSSPTTRTCSRRAARTTTPTSPPGTTSAAHESDPWRTRPDPSCDRARRMIERAGREPYDNSRVVLPRGGRLPGAAHDGGGGALARRERGRSTSASSCSSTSSTRTSRSTRRSRTRRCTTARGTGRT